MNTDSTMSLIYLVLLLAAVGGWIFTSGRRELGKLAQQMAAWALIFVGVIAAVGLWDDIRGTVMPSQAVLQGGEISVPRAPDGHYYLDAVVNGTPVRFMVDTGATDIVLTQADAAAAGIDPRGLVYSARAMSANGEVGIAPVVLDRVAIGPVETEGVRAMVNGGDMRQSLLGMRYLQQFSKMEIGDGALILTP